MEALVTSSVHPNPAQDAVLASGADVAGLRALLACAYTRPLPEPARPFSHWDAVLAEAHWLAVDFAQERLWKASTALAVAAEVAGKRGEFGLRPPPPEHRAFHDEIVAARAAAVAAAAAVAGKRLTAAARAEAGAGLALDPTADPIWADLALEAIPPTPPGFDYALVYSVEPELAPALEATLESRELERAIEADMVCRGYRYELDAALRSHFAAVAEASKRAMRLDADLADGCLLGDAGDGADLADDGDPYAQKGKRGKGGRRAGYLLDDFAELGDAEFAERAPPKRAASRQYIEDTYLRKRRRERYRDVDADYDAEDELLLATVHEFGLNWTLVSEVLSLSLGLQGIHRPGSLCKQRFRHLTAQEGQDYSEERALAALNQQLSKQQARELLVQCLPVRDDVLMRLLEALAQIGGGAKSRRAAEEKRAEAVRTRRQETHASHASVMGHVLAQTAGRRLTPLELSSAVNNAYLNQAKQQAALAEQAAQGASRGGNALVLHGVGGLWAGAGSITLQQLNHILATNKLPNGQPLSSDMRDAIQKKRDAYLAPLQAPFYGGGTGTIPMPGPPLARDECN
ncbi:E1A-binding protein p400 [Auxenochlorella protothecoides]|uniref:E1A-binding protein p400 n=1 Tax=Auxenochlorella protothecoides TaxID=3075 RepID=A0A087SQ61_AUXPR|nr:E1A-binding protein p400 [Auxenochlorella protothecoides]KFM27865.1 E1A-binding protein p400 [Auxenochlorella protothecoides]